MQTAIPSHDRPAGILPGAQSHLTPGQKLAGCYVLRREHGRGAATSIWLAFDEVLGKEVSLHFVPEAIRGDQQAMEELRQEIKRNRQLIHPNILRIYDLIEESDWVAISMDAIAGESLAALREKKAGGFFEVAEIKPWLTQLSQTLEDAHKIQLVHRDLAPENIFVEKDGRILVASFGVSRCIRDALWRNADESRAAENMSPQMLDGQTSTAADDIYATGVLLHELLAGQPPFAGADLAEEIRNTAPGKILDCRSRLKKAGGPIPPNWEKVVAACLEKNPDQRPKSMGDFAARLALDKLGQTSPSARESEAVEVEPVKNSAPEAKPAAPMAQPAPQPKIVQPPKPSAVPVKGPAILAKEPVAAVTEPAKELAAKANEVPAAAVSLAAVMPNETAASSPVEQATAVKAELISETPPELHDQNAIPDHYPTLNSHRSGFPITGLAAAVLLIGLCLYAVFYGGFGKQEAADLGEEIPPESQTEGAGVVEVSAKGEPVSENATPETPSVRHAEATGKLPFDEVSGADLAAPDLVAFPAKPEIEDAVILAAKAKPVRDKPEKPAAAATPVPALPSTVGLIAAKVAALEAIKKAADEAEKAHQDLLKKKEQAEAAAAEAKKTLDDRTVAVAPMLKGAEEGAALRMKREEEMRTAELAAEEARKVAEEKARIAADAKKAVASVDKETKDKLAAQQKAEAELSELKKSAAEKERLAGEAAKMAEAAKIKKDEQMVALQQTEQQLAQAKAAAEEAAKMELARRMEQEEKRARIKKEMDEAKRVFEERMKALEASLKEPEDSAAPPEKLPVEKVPAPAKPETPAPVAPKPLASENAAPPTGDPVMLAKLEPQKPAGVPAIETKPEVIASGVDPTNSIGMKFVPVGEVQFSVWPTRVKDFETFANATGLKSTLWRDPGFKQGPEHPVVNVTWLEAMAFCKWLTFKEQREGTLPAAKIYRLPTDLEWSKAAGLSEEIGKTPEVRDMGVPDVYPWGNQWPPPSGAGNYTGEETGSEVAIKGYNDGFPWTAPVGSFEPNKYGLYDMGGNVWQWVMDAWSTDPQSKVLRGASWYNGALKLSLLSSCRVHAAHDSSTDNYGFRCVIANEAPRSSKR